MTRFHALILAVAVLASACNRNTSRTALAPTHPDVVLITIDTLRADRVGRGLTPAIDAVAARGVRFTHARSAVPLTLPSHVSIMTGLLPAEHGVHENGTVFKPDSPPLARVFSNAGYTTAAFVGAYVLDRRFGLSNGFDTYDDRVSRDPAAMARLEAERKGGAVADAAIHWLSTARRPYFLWVHLYDPHAPYEPPAEFLAKAGGNAYDGEVAYADAQVARVLDAVRQRDPSNGTIIAIAGDHGEGLGEHGEQTHGMLAYDSTLRVPLVVAAPGLAPKSVDAPVSLVELAPSILRKAGLIEQIPARVSARDLFSSPADREAYAETLYPRTAGWHTLAALASDRWKLVLSSEPELYDIAADPGETHNLQTEHAPIVQGMTKRIGELQSDAVPESTAGVAPDAAERLRALGYVSGSSSRTIVDPSAPNPASVIGAWEEFERALALMNTGHAAQAIEPLQALSSRFPAAQVFHATWARALVESGKPADAVALYRKAVARWPKDSDLYHELAVAARAAGQTGEAMKAEQAALVLDGSSPAALNGLGLLNADAGRASQAAEFFESAATRDPSNASYWTNLGNARREEGNLPAAEGAYRRALEADPTYPDAANGLGVILVQQNKASDAIPWFQRALQQSPDFHEARLNLGIAYQQSGDVEKARIAFQEVLAKAPASMKRERKAAQELLQGGRR